MLGIAAVPAILQFFGMIFILPGIDEHFYFQLWKVSIYAKSINLIYLFLGADTEYVVGKLINTVSKKQKVFLPTLRHSPIFSDTKHLRVHSHADIINFLAFSFYMDPSSTYFLHASQNLWRVFSQIIF